MYAFLFLLGFFGFVGMAGLSSLLAGHQSHTGHHHGGSAHSLGGAKAITHSQSGHAGGAKIAAKGGRMAKGGRGRHWWALSPFDIFAFCTGAGAVGEILRNYVTDAHLTMGAAVLGALVFDFAIAKPVLNALLSFESRPSAGLEGSTAQRGEAATRFDAEGRGLVQLALDGQIVQVLGILDREERDRGVVVAKGDPLLIVDVDAAKNTCRVTRELAS